MELLNKAGIDWVNEQRKDDESDHIAVVIWRDKKFGVFQGWNCPRMIAAMNSAEYNDNLSNLGMIKRIVGIKEVTEERTFERVTKKFQDIAGEENVYTLCLA